MARWSKKDEVRPRFRGAVDLFAIAIFSPAVVVICWHAYPNLVPALIYGVGLLLLFGISGGYHFFTWGPRALAVWQRLDHAMIYVFIAASYTPAAMTTMAQPTSTYLMILVWSCAVLGLLKTLFWPSAPRWLTVLLYICMGWSVLIWFDDFTGPLDAWTIFWFIAGGVIYSLAGVIYAVRWPSPWPKTFGYHEVMHVVLILAVCAQYCAQWRVLQFG